MKRLSALALALAAACSAPAAPPRPDGAHPRFRLSARPRFLDVPWPSDLALRDDGTLNLDGFPSHSVSIQDFIDVIATSTHGFGLESAAYFQLDRDLDPATLPAPDASLGKDSAIWLMDVEPGSPHAGERLPVEARMQVEPYLPAHTLAVLPLSGFPLRPKTRYAIALTSALRGVDGLAAQPEDDLAVFLEGAQAPGAVSAKAAPLYVSALDVLEQHGLARSSVVGLAAFTTQDATGAMTSIAAQVLAAPPASITWSPYDPSLTTAPPSTGTYDPCCTAADAKATCYEGTLTAPKWQRGAPPFTADGSGDLVLGANGPSPQGTLEFAIGAQVPQGTPPAGGWPVVLYGHGSGGSRWSYLEQMGCAVTRAGFALVSLDFPLHGKRVTGLSPELAIINVANPVAGRAFPQQAASDLVALRRAINAGVRPGGGAPLSTSGALYLSQSMGGFVGPIAMAVDPGFTGAAMNGAGGGQFLYYLPRTKDTEATAGALDAVPTFLNLEKSQIDRFEVLMNLAQTFIEPGDAVTYARLLAREPAPGASARSLLFLEGDRDQYVANASTDALAVAAGCDDVQSPAAALSRSLALTGHSLLAPPVSGNLLADNHQRATCGVYLQHYDHFSLDECASAEAQVGAFFSSVLAGSPTIAAQADPCTK